MSRKYIRQEIVENFVYPNNTIDQYDIEIIHDINDNSVSGSINTFTLVSASSTGLTFNLNYTWNKNNAEPWIRNSGLLGVLSVHMLTPNQLYYKPWRIIQTQAYSNLSLTTVTAITTFSTTPTQMGVAAFTTGVYNFEMRFIGRTSIYPICTTLNITVP